MTNFRFWQRWLAGVGLILIIFGLALAFFSQTVVFDILFNARVNPVFWGEGAPVGETQLFQQWIYGVLGATVAGWGFFAYFIARYPFANKERWAWRCLATGTTVWFVADTTISAYFGVWVNVLLNVAIYGAIMLPVVFTRKEFSQSPS